jgi:hypothetical protein
VRPSEEKFFDDFRNSQLVTYSDVTTTRFGHYRAP